MRLGCADDDKPVSSTRNEAFWVEVIGVARHIISPPRSWRPRYWTSRSDRYRRATRSTI
jgi:hypothetical protein